MTERRRELEAELQSLASGSSEEDDWILDAIRNQTDLDDGDLKYTVDFRSIYATVMADWFGLPVSSALDGEFAKLDLVRAG